MRKIGVGHTQSGILGFPAQRDVGKGCFMKVLQQQDYDSEFGQINHIDNLSIFATGTRFCSTEKA